MSTLEIIRNRRPIIAVALLAAGLGGAVLAPGLLAADGGGHGSARGSDGATRTTGTTGDEAAAGEKAPDAPLPDGRHFGEVEAAYVAPRELAFDPMELLTGDAAHRAARADGVGEDDLGDFFLRDTEERPVSLPVAGDVIVTRVDCSGGPCEEGSPIDYDAFTMSVGPDSGAKRTFWLTIADGLVVRIDEQYLP